MNRAYQLSLFDQHTLNVDRELHESIHLAAKKCGLSREEIVERMNALAAKYGIRLVKGNGNQLNMGIFEKWLNPNDTTHIIGIKALPVFCAAVGDHTPLDVLARPLGYQVIGDDEQRLLKWARANLRKREALRELRQIENEMEVG
jgi:hypothetical protein